MIHRKTVLASVQQSGVCIYLSRRWETIKTKMIAHFEMQQQRHNEIAATSGTKPDKMSFFINGSLFYSLPQKKPSFSINEGGNWVQGPAGYGLSMMAWGPNLTLSLHGGISHSRPLNQAPPPQPSPPLTSKPVHPFLIRRWVALAQTAISGEGR